jgi:hypothetical protein
MLEIVKDDSYDIVLRLETRFKTLELLKAKVRATYAGLIMVEEKCIEED